MDERLKPIKRFLDKRKDRFTYEFIEDDIIQITTPFLDRLDDKLQITVHVDSSSVVIMTDDGFTYWFLDLEEFSIGKTDTFIPRFCRIDAKMKKFCNTFKLEISKSDHIFIELGHTQKDIGEKMGRFVACLLNILG